ncbi:Fic family protein [Thiothrix subterranea]|uniref:Fic family protein n=1 Tax=Thiothrix subterranea TaxID=2735563 RepID=UPI00280A924C|nr:Fic family protein [Thiothrix subterranea]
MADNMTDNTEILLQILRKLDKPAAISDILPHLDITERTLHRWLAEAVTSGQIQATGTKRGRRYTVAKMAETNLHPYFSATALQLLHQIRQPLITREPCTYRPEWLAAYQPNQTFYLSARQREILLQQGQQLRVELPAGTYAQRIFNRLLIDLSYNSSRLEGNTYSLLDTQKLLLEGMAADNKLDAEKIMLLNHKDAIRFLVDGIQRLDITPDNIRSLHYLLADGLVTAGAAGQIRQDSVRISASTYLPMDNQTRLTQQLSAITTTAQAITDPFEQSFFLLVHIAYLQAFIDVNKRTSRLACNIPLVRHNLVPLSFNDMDKDDYASAVLVTYERNDVTPLAELYVSSYLRSCKLYSVTVEAMGIDPLRVQYRQARRELIRAIVQQSLHGDALAKHIQAYTKTHIPPEHQEKFAADLHADLANLAPFNIAGMGFSVRELEAWLLGCET